VGDLRESNLLVAPSGLVVLIDCDSFQVRDDEDGRVYHCRVGSGEYLPPELQAGVDFSRLEVDRLEADRFSLAVLVFRFL
jgi:DNA-binding helix-hairpin-helix protein with protein kinase domain